MTEQAGQFDKVLSLKGQAKEEAIRFANQAAFYNHLVALGEHQHTTPDLITGRTLSSIPAYYRLPRLAGSNPVNDAALDLIPNIGYKSAYGNSVDRYESANAYRRALSIPETETGIEEARSGLAVHYLVAQALGLTQSPIKVKKGETKLVITDLSRIDNADKAKVLVKGITDDLDEQVVDEVSAIYNRVNKRGYVDFLDYLLDVKDIIEERVQTVFEHGPNKGPDAN